MFILRTMKFNVSAKCIVFLSCKIALISCILYSAQIPLIPCILYSAQILLISCIFCAQIALIPCILYSAQIPLISCFIFHRFRSFRSNSAHSGPQVWSDCCKKISLTENETFSASKGKCARTTQVEKYFCDSVIQFSMYLERAP